MQHQRDTAAAATAATTMEHVLWSNKLYTPVEIVDDFATRFRMPVLVRAAIGNKGINAIEAIRRDQVFIQSTSVKIMYM